MIPVIKLGNEVCKRCNSQCQNNTYTDLCNGHNFEIFNNTFGCEECKCKCPDVNCDAQCGGDELGLFGPIDMAGCRTCIGCRESSQ